jgi:hypothetical protein
MDSPVDGHWGWGESFGWATKRRTTTTTTTTTRVKPDTQPPYPTPGQVPTHLRLCQGVLQSVHHRQEHAAQVRVHVQVLGPRGQGGQALALDGPVGPVPQLRVGARLTVQHPCFVILDQQRVYLGAPPKDVAT